MGIYQDDKKLNILDKAIKEIEKCVINIIIYLILF